VADLVGHAAHEYVGSLAERGDLIACVGVGEVDRHAALPATED
jgi:hypothetical protein